MTIDSTFTLATAVIDLSNAVKNLGQRVKQLESRPAPEVRNIAYNPHVETIAYVVHSAVPEGFAVTRHFAISEQEAILVVERIR